MKKFQNFPKKFHSKAKKEKTVRIHFTLLWKKNQGLKSAAEIERAPCRFALEMNFEKKSHFFQERLDKFSKTR